MSPVSGTLGEFRIDSIEDYGKVIESDMRMVLVFRFDADSTNAAKIDGKTVHTFGQFSVSSKTDKDDANEAKLLDCRGFVFFNLAKDQDSYEVYDYD